MATKKNAPSKTAGNKETVYVDVDDEITNIIDKVKKSDQKIVALVLPKRATALQSVVNMKLLKKAAQSTKKSVVLITSETGLMPLAGAAGLHVAKSLQSKPEIPPPPRQPGADDETETIGDEEDVVLDKTASIGALAAAPARDDDTETIELDNLQVEPPASGAAAVKPKRQKHLRVPNFEKFRLGFFLAGLGLVLLLAGWYVAFVVLPKANIVIATDTTSVVSSFDFTASTTQTTVDAEAGRVPAVLKEVKKTDTETLPATGERDDGTRAEGEVTLSVPCATGDSTVVPSGTAVSTGGLNFITQETARLDNHASGPCRFTDTVEVRAAQNGDSYNIGNGRNFTVAGFSGVSGSNSSGFSGGTSKIVKIVSQKDIDTALNRITERLNAQIDEELGALFDADELLALTETKRAGDPAAEATPAVDEESDEVVVKAEITYTMLGIERADLVEVIKADIDEEIDLEKQSISDDGIDSAIMRLNNQPNPNEAFISFRTSVTAGPEIDVDAIKEAVRGKKRGEVEQYLDQQPGVDDVLIEYSPFWVYSTPKAAKKITIEIKHTGEQDQAADGNGR